MKKLSTLILCFVLLLSFSSACFAIPGKITVKERYVKKILAVTEDGKEAVFVTFSNAFWVTKGESYDVSYTDFSKSEFELMDDKGKRYIFIKEEVEAAPGCLMFSF